MSKPSPPPAPNFTGAANAQGQANQTGANATNTASRVNQYTPYGSQTFAQDPNDPNKWTSTIALDPAQQGLLNTQNTISAQMGNAALNTSGQVTDALSKPFDLSGLPALQSGPGDVSKAYDELMARQNTQFGQQDDSLRQRLVNQGLTPGTEAWNRAYQPLDQSRVDASNQADIQANQLGLNLAGFQNNARSQGMSEQSYLRGLPLQELNALRAGSSVSSPTFQQFPAANVGAAPLFDAATQQYNAANQQYGNKVGAYNNMVSGAFDLGGQMLKGTGVGGKIVSGAKSLFGLGGSPTTAAALGVTPAATAAAGIGDLAAAPGLAANMSGASALGSQMASTALGSGAAGAGGAGLLAGGAGGYASSPAVLEAINAAIPGASGAAGAGAAGAGAAAAPSAAAAAPTSALGAAAAAAIPAAVLYAGMSSQPYTLNAGWWNTLKNQLINGTSGNATYDTSATPAQQRNQAKDSLYHLILSGPTHNDFGQAGPGLPADIQALAKSYGMLNADGSVNKTWQNDPYPQIFKTGSASRGRAPN